MARLNDTITSNLQVTGTVSMTSCKIIESASATNFYGNGSGLSSIVISAKGNSESSYRTGNINITAANIGAANASHSHTKSAFTNFPNIVYGVKGNAESSYRNGANINLTYANIGAAPASHGNGNHSSAYANDLLTTIILWTNSTCTSSFAGQTLTGTNTTLQSVYLKGVTISFRTHTDQGTGGLGGFQSFGYTGEITTVETGAITDRRGWRFYGTVPSAVILTKSCFGFTTGDYYYGRRFNENSGGPCFQYRMSDGMWTIIFGSGYRSGSASDKYCIPYQIIGVY